MKKIPTTKFLDKLHRGVVVACIGLTAYGTLLIGHRVYRYFTVIKPQREEIEWKMLEVNFDYLRFVNIIKAYFVFQETPVDAATLVDNAPKLRS